MPAQQVRQHGLRTVGDVPQLHASHRLQQGGGQVKKSADTVCGVSDGLGLGLRQCDELLEGLCRHRRINVQHPWVFDRQAQRGKVTLNVIRRAVKKSRVRRKISDGASPQGIAVGGGFRDEFHTQQLGATRAIFNYDGYAEICRDMLRQLAHLDILPGARRAGDDNAYRPRWKVLCSNQTNG